jgi:outer membrane protein
MFLKLRAGALLALAPLASLAAQGAATQKVMAYIDSRYIVNNAPGTPAAQAVLQKEGDAAQAQVKRMSDSLDMMTTSFQKEQAALTVEKRDARIKSINEKQTEFQQRYDAIRQAADERQAEVMQPILDQIKLVIEDVRTEQGYSFIIDIGQNAAIVAADKNLNISDRVLAKLRTMPVPAIADKATGTKAADTKGKAAGPTGGPLSSPAGVRGAAGAPTAKKADTGTKADTTKPKKPDSTGVKKPSGF